MGRDSRDPRTAGSHFRHLEEAAPLPGHFFNWYGTRDLAPLPPDYVSSVDSGNLAGHLITLANACEEWTQTPLAPDALQGIADAHALACAACAALPSAGSPSARAVEEALAEIHGQLTGLQAAEVMTPVLKRLVDKAARLALQLAPATGEDPAADVAFWIEAIGRAVNSHDQDRLRLRTPDGSSAHLRGSPRSPPPHAPWRWRWTSPSCWIPSASCCPSAMR